MKQGHLAVETKYEKKFYEKNFLLFNFKVSIKLNYDFRMMGL